MLFNLCMQYCIIILYRYKQSDALTVTENVYEVCGRGDANKFDTIEAMNVAKHTKTLDDDTLGDSKF